MKNKASLLHLRQQLLEKSTLIPFKETRDAETVTDSQGKLTKTPDGVLNSGYDNNRLGHSNLNT